MEVDEYGASGSGSAPAPPLHEQKAGLPWVEKYRPSTLDSVVSQNDIVSTINKFLDSGRLPHLLFYGPPGTGKTTTILACARRIYGEALQNFVLELNASDDRGIGIVRDQIKTFASTRQIFSSAFKLIILDEADQLTSEAQSALRRVMEKYTRNARFCLICNNVNKIIPALQSRCTRFRFAPLRTDQILPRLREIAEQERLTVTDKALAAIVRLANGDMRKCLNVLQSTAMARGTIDVDDVYLNTGNPKPSEIKQIMEWLCNESFANCMRNIQLLQTTHGHSLVDILRFLYPYVVKMELEEDSRGYLLQTLADVENRLASGCHEHSQLGAVVGAFIVVREAELSDDKRVVQLAPDILVV